MFIILKIVVKGYHSYCTHMHTMQTTIRCVTLLPHILLSHFFAWPHKNKKKKETLLGAYQSYGYYYKDNTVSTKNKNIQILFLSGV